MVAKSCLFCEKGFLKEDFPNRLVRQKYTTAVLDINQFYPGRTLVIFNEHVEDLYSLSENIRTSFWSEVLKVAKVIQEVMKADRINYALLCNREHHLHWHIIPRYKSEPYFTSNPWRNPDAKKEASEEEMRERVKLIRSKFSKT